MIHASSIAEVGAFVVVLGFVAASAILVGLVIGFCMGYEVGRKALRGGIRR